MKRTGSVIQYLLMTLALGAAIAVVPARAQSQAATPDRDTDLNRQQLAAFDQFLDGHPELAEQIRQDPSLVNNQEFLQNHADLQHYLQQHPEVREGLVQNPNAVMHQEQRFDQREDRDRDRHDPDVTRRELANMDAFMDSHPEIAEQLRKDPSLVNDKQFVANHPALEQFLAEHPGVREEYRENPNAFMRQENRFDRREDYTRRDRDVTGGELSSFHEFLEGHGSISTELSKNPSLANNQEYVENHPELREYLKAHPKVHEELGENPQSFITSAQRFESTQKTTPKPMPRPTTEPKMK
jgi:hypothetical protein